MQRIDLPTEIFNSLKNSTSTDIFVFDDWQSRQYFWKHFLSGVFIQLDDRSRSGYDAKT